MSNNIPQHSDDSKIKTNFFFLTVQWQFCFSYFCTIVLINTNNKQQEIHTQYKHQCNKTFPVFFFLTHTHTCTHTGNYKLLATVNVFRVGKKKTEHSEVMRKTNCTVDS